jgi:hypothetical protein
LYQARVSGQEYLGRASVQSGIVRIGPSSSANALKSIDRQFV